MTDTTVSASFNETELATAIVALEALLDEANEIERVTGTAVSYVSIATDLRSRLLGVLATL